MKNEDMLEGVVFSLGAGEFFCVGTSGGSVAMVKRRNGSEKIFEVDPEQALAIARALQAVAICAKHSKDKI